MSRNFACMLVYQMGIQIYDQISIARKLSKVKLHRAFSLEFDLKQVKIDRNIAKFGVHACISTGHPNLWSNFSILGIWSKVKLHHAVSLRFGVKEGKRALNITKFGMHCYLPNGHLNIWSYFNSKNLVKRETLSCAFTKVAHKGSEIARNIVKVSMYAYLLKWVPKSTFKFHFWESQQKCIFSTFHDHPWMRAKIAPNLIKIGVHGFLWFLTSKTAWNPLKVCMHGYLSNGYLNSLSNFNYKKVGKITSLDISLTNLE